MPANLTTQYHKAEQAYRQASTPEEELTCLQDMLRELPKHKGSENLQSELKQKISKAKKAAQDQSKSGKKSSGFRLPRQGAGRAVIIGGPNAGKSQLLATLTRATPEIAVYPFTTHQPLPGMMMWEDVAVQLVDTPPITCDVFDPVTQSLIRSADVILLMVDLGDDDGIEHVQDVLEKLAATKTRLARDSYLDENDIGVSYTRTFAVLNKVDLPEAAERIELLNEFCPLDFETFQVSAQDETTLETLRETVYKSMDVVRVYTKMPNKKDADYDRPYTIPRGGTLLEVAQLIHRDFAENLKFAKVWGEAVHDGTTVKGDYVLHDKDVVELHV